ncbi:MAG: hypothetical protein HQL75_01400 [Magnetococcales bacterium]|nr:hypothetical protein [Magnetococcales bacterium]
MPTLTIKSLHCVETQGIGDDDTYITIGGEKVWGVVVMGEDDKQPVNIDYHFSRKAWVQIWEKDSGGDDLIGGFEVQSTHRGEKRHNIKGDGSEYWVYYSVKG